MATQMSTRALHGRDDVLALAEQRLDASEASSGRLLLLAGEAGIGKTRLLHELQGRADARGFSLWSAAASPQDVELAGGLLLDLGHGLARHDAAGVAALGRGLVADFADLPEATAYAGDAHRRRRLLVLDVAARLATLADGGPALLALEDLHWSDELSLEIVGHLARRLSSLPLLVVGTLRTDELHDQAPVRAWRSRLLLQRLAEEVQLGRLQPAETARMVGELLPGPAVAGGVVELVHERSGGVPLHVEELVRAAEQGHLSADPRYVPETLAEAICLAHDLGHTPFGHAGQDAPLPSCAVPSTSTCWPRPSGARTTRPPPTSTSWSPGTSSTRSPQDGSASGTR